MRHSSTISNSSFGSSITEMQYTNDTGKNYRFGFNGKEKDDETNVDGGSYDFGSRIYDSRLGRWYSTDFLQAKFSNLSPYIFSKSSPLLYNDPNGKEAIVTITGNKITISATVYLQDNGLIATKNISVKDIQNSINDYFNSAIKDQKYIVNGQEYEIEVNVSLVEGKMETGTAIDWQNGDNVVRIGKDEEISVSRFERLYNWGEIRESDFTNHENKTLFHEVGHLLGLGHDQFIKYLGQDGFYVGDGNPSFGVPTHSIIDQNSDGELCSDAPINSAERCIDISKREVKSYDMLKILENVKWNSDQTYGLITKTHQVYATGILGPTDVKITKPQPILTGNDISKNNNNVFVLQKSKNKEFVAPSW